MSTRLASPCPAFMYISASAPEAPPLSDTTIGAFIRWFFWIAACIIRAIWSEAPPAPAATTISTGLVGSQAAAGVAIKIGSSAIAPAADRRSARVRFIGVLPEVFKVGDLDDLRYAATRSRSMRRTNASAGCSRPAAATRWGQGSAQRGLH